MTHNRINAYHIMWLFLFFDLPVCTKRQRKQATKFRKDIEALGFKMMQFSVYACHCPSYQHADALIDKITHVFPDEGNVKILSVTDKQFSKIFNYWGKPESSKNSRIKDSKIPVQLQLEFY